MLTLQFITYAEIEHLSSPKRIKRIMDIVKKNKIVLLEGRLRQEEEKDLIEMTMEEIDDTFKGIELAVIHPEKKQEKLLRKLRYRTISMLLGNRMGFTIIGPATVIKEIKRDPEKIQLFTKDINKVKI